MFGFHYSFRESFPFFNVCKSRPFYETNTTKEQTHRAIVTLVTCIQNVRLLSTSFLTFIKEPKKKKKKKGSKQEVQTEPERRILLNTFSEVVIPICDAFVVFL